MVYISDSGIFCNPLKGGILVYDNKANKAKRVLSAPEWVNDENFTFKIHGRDVLKAKDGKPNPMKTGADGDMNFDNPKVPNFRIYRLKVSGKPYHAK